MKNFFLILGVVILYACSVMPSSHGSAEGVAEAAERLRLVMIDPDQAKLDALVAANVSYGHSSGKVDNKSMFIGDLVNGSSDFVAINISNQTVGGVARPQRL